MPHKPGRKVRIRPPSYWRSYHSSNASLWHIINLIEAVVLELGSPWEVSRRGRPPKFLPEQHALYCILTAFMGWTLRQAEACLALLGVSIDHSTVGKAMQRLPESYLEEAIALLNRRISQLLGRSGIFAADSTGITCDRSKRKVVRALRVVEVEEHVKLHIIAELRAGLLTIACAKASAGEAHDAPRAREMLAQGEFEGVLLADSAYDSEQLYETCFERGLTPVVKPRKNSRRGRFRKRARKCFSSEVYRFRGVVEGVFGAIELKYRARIRARKRKTKAVAALLLAVAYNLSATLRAITMGFEMALRDKGYVLVVIRRQPRFRSNTFEHFRVVYIALLCY